MVGIYKITNITNMKCYIGQSVDIDHRIKVHKFKLSKGYYGDSHFQRAYNKDPNSFKFEIIEECKIDQLDDREIYWIDFYRAYDKGFGYNNTLGGKSIRGYKFTNEQKQKLGDSLRGKPFSYSHKESLSKSMRVS